MISLPRLYAILDSSCFTNSEDLSLAAEELVAAGVSLIQYRNKTGEAQIMLTQARELRRRSRTEPALSLSKGVSAPHGHGQFARRIIGPERWLGVSTHNPRQVAEADKTSAGYIAIGPVFATGSKANPDPVIDLA